MLVCIGTRPEVVKLAPVIQELRLRRQPVITVATGQHREMLDQAFAAFEITPDIDLELMRPAQTLAEITSRAVKALDRVIAESAAASVLVQGDTTTAMCGALAAFYQGVPVGHVEAGLRTWDRANPFPEEINRRLIGQLASWHFCPTQGARSNLLREDIDGNAIHVTGNTVVDAALWMAERRQSPHEVGNGRRRVLVTMHRRESQGEPQRRLAKALVDLANRSDVEILFPVHLSPAVRESVMPVLTDQPHITVCDPIGYEEMIDELMRCDLVLTDSGGLQEEAPSFNVPVIVMRNTTERPEGVEAGCSVLCGTDPADVLAMANRLLDDRGLYRSMADAPNPYGDGRAAERIVDVLLDSAAVSRAQGEVGERADARATASLVSEPS